MADDVTEGATPDAEEVKTEVAQAAQADAGTVEVAAEAPTVPTEEVATEAAPVVKRKRYGNAPQRELWTKAEKAKLTKLAVRFALTFPTQSVGAELTRFVIECHRETFGEEPRCQCDSVVKDAAIRLTVKRPDWLALAGQLRETIDKEQTADNEEER